MIDEAIDMLSNSRNTFEANVNDEFGRSIVADYYEPCHNEANGLREAIEEADREGRKIRDMLQQVRAMV